MNLFFGVKLTKVSPYATCCNDKGILILLNYDNEAVRFEVYNRSLLFPGKFDSLGGNYVFQGSSSLRLH